MKEQPLDFLVRFALTAALGCAAIILAAPFVRPAVLPDWLAEPSQAVRARPGLAQLADRLAKALLWSPASRRSMTPTAATAPIAAVDETPRWAVVKALDVPVYRTNGQYWQRLAVGTALTAHGFRASSVGFMVICRLPPPAPPDASDFLVRRDQIDLFEGSLDAVSPDVLDLHQHHARLCAELERIKASENGRNRTDNPQWPAYSRARHAYDQSSDRARRLRQEFEHATGDQRMRLADELRSLKGEEVRLSQALAATRRDYDAWNASHPVSARSQDPRVQTLESEIASVSARLSPPAPAP
ncbi:MAG: hypothetical protein K8T26_11690 [Lentisphaerae bacterium]|nr:hypothetical protein [Lentisphaerota bacterium]